MLDRNNESRVLGVSLRGWIALIITLTVCIMSFMKIEIIEPFYSISLFVVGFYFGQKTPKEEK